MNFDKRAKELGVLIRDPSGFKAKLKEICAEAVAEASTVDVTKADEAKASERLKIASIKAKVKLAADYLDKIEDPGPTRLKRAGMLIKNALEEIAIYEED